MNDKHTFIKMPDGDSKINDLDPRIINDIMTCIQEWILGNGRIDPQSGWDLDNFYRVEVMDNNNFAFYKLVAQNGQPKVAAMHVERERYERWLEDQ